jgi:hypothetical protein
MKLVKPFNQTILIQKTGSPIPAGVCMGLVVQWLMSIAPIIDNESQYWKDLDESVDPNSGSGLLGVGYAKKAIGNQADYNKYFKENHNHDYINGILKEAGLDRLPFPYSLELTPPDQGAEKYSGLIGKKAAQDSGQYFILGIRGTQFGHAIGLFRKRFFGEVSIFDPNIGKYECSKEPEDVAEAIDTIMSDPFYNQALNYKWEWNCYEK